jgi:hypothetical protein
MDIKKEGNPRDRHYHINSEFPLFLSTVSISISVIVANDWQSLMHTCTAYLPSGTSYEFENLHQNTSVEGEVRDY